jgi:hypothetical protein
MQKIFSSRNIILISVAICFFVTTNIHWGKNKWQNIIEADARGYYAYLPAVFIYHDLNFSFYDSIEKTEYYNSNWTSEYRAKVNGGTVNKYFCGTAIAQSPFFLIAHALTYITGDASDGYSRIYMLFVTIAALFYLLAGLLFTDKLLMLYDIKNNIRSIVLIAILFGSNLFFYSVCEMGMSHVYSFSFVAMFLYFAKKYFITFQGRDLFLLFFLSGFIFLIRPVNILVFLCLPFLAGSFTNLLTGIKILAYNKQALIYGLLSMLLLLSIQSIIYKISTGNFWVDSYPGENFDFSNPHFFSVLLSYKKGLFIYTPLYLLSLSGLFFLYKKNRFEFFMCIAFFVILTFVLSSWWNWWYGGSFSSRVYVEYLPVFGILLGIFLNGLVNSIIKITFTILILLLIALCQFQIYQYRYYVIHWENMTSEKYWDVFLKMKK